MCARHRIHTHIGSTCAVECILCLTPVCCCTARGECELVLSGLALVVELRKRVCRGNAGVVEGIDSTHLCIRHLFIHLHIHLPVILSSTTLSIYMCARSRSCLGALTLPQLRIHHFLLPHPLHESQVLIPPLPPFPILNWSQASVQSLHFKMLLKSDLSAFGSLNSLPLY